MPVKRGKLKSGDAQRIQLNFNYLISEVDANDIVSTLFSKNVFTSDDKEEIKNQPSKGKRTEMLLDKLMHSGPGEAYEVFISALREDYQHVAEKLEKTVVEKQGPEDFEAWYAKLPDDIKSRKITDSDASRLAAIDGLNWTQFFMRLPTNVSYFEKTGVDNINNVTAALIRWRQRKVKEANIGNFMSVLFELDKERFISVDWDSVQDVMDRLIKSLKK